MIKLYSRIFTALAFLLCFKTYSQNVATIGTGTNVNTTGSYPAPYGNYWFGAKHQFLITASELSSAGLGSGSNISKLAFNVATAQGVALVNFTIKLANTSLSTLNTNFQTSGFTTVFGPQTYTETVGWNTHNFSTNYNWNGTSNILVEVCFNNNNWTNNAVTYYTNTSFNSSLFYYQDNTGVCSNTSGTTSTSRPNMKLTYSASNIPPVANFKANKTFTCDGSINFTDTSCCGVTSWLWNFGDGTTSTQQNPTHNYTVNGTYTVSLLTTNAFGSNSITKNNYITVALGTGPIAASCTPTTTGYCCGFGITNVTFANINNTTADASGGYSNYTCTAAANVFEGASYPISVSTPQPSAHNVRVWIDYNNDGIFTPASELVFSGNSTLVASGNIVIPVGAVLNTPLRMRVSADFDGFAAPTPCSNLTYGQAEDYSVTILQNNNPPLADFSANLVSTCDGVVSFTDLSQNTPTQWHWNFGDGGTDTIQNPVYAYSVNGVYAVTLISTNGFGSDTIVKNNYINVTLGNAPVNASCSPATASYCCGYGIFNVSLNTINNSTGSAAESYKDFSCSQSTTLTESYVYNIQIQTSVTDSQDTKVWIDWNNNGSFNTNELVVSSLNSSSVNVNFTVPAGVTLNTPLRMRVSSDYSGGNPGACTNPVYGQVEDYGVIIIPNLNPPVADFSASSVSSCDGIISFSDASLNPVLAWNWNFGDGTTDTVQNPVHSYANTGTYTVTLIVTNNYGTNTIIKNNYVNIISLTGGSVAPTCIPQTASYCCGMGITNVTMNTLNSSSPDGIEGYRDFGCEQQTSVIAGQNYGIAIVTGTQYAENIVVWIDYNNNGTFNNTNEKVYSDNALFNHNGTIAVSSSAVLNTPLRMRIASDYNTIANSCNDVQYGQVEDYTIVVLPNTIPPVVSYTANTTATCNGIVTFNNTTSNGTSFIWNFGDGTTSTVQNPTHTYASPGTYTVFLKSCNAFGCDSLTKINYITVSTGGPATATCAPQTTTYCCGMGIYNVTFNSINKTSNDGSDGYKDYSCTNQTNVTAGQSYNLSVTTGTQYSEYVNVWIDYNNDGAFNNSNELVFSNASLINHAGTISISSAAVLNTPLRMRVASDYNILVSGCTNVQYGQVEDYSVTILPNTVPPVVTFNANSTTTCNGIIMFNNTTTNGTSFIWNFGDGTTSTIQNPSHTYASPGTYTVFLKSCNVFGCDSLTKINYVTVSTGGPITASCAPQTTGYCCGIGIYNVTLNTINNTTNDGVDGYKDYSCTNQTTVTAGQNYTLSVTTGNQYYEYVKVFIDYNNDGTYNNTNELVFTDYILANHTGTINISSAAVLNTPLRMRVISDYNTIVNGCTDVEFGQAEDYSITILPNTVPPVVDFNTTTTTTCNGIIVFNNMTSNGTSFFWDFGDGTTSTVQNPTHTYTAAGTYTVFLKSCNAFGCDSLTQVNYITVSTGGPITASCAPQTTTYCCGMGIYNVTFNSINKTSNDGSDGYKDYSCSNQTNITAGQNYNLSVTTGTQYSEYLKVWIDYNNDGSFNNTNEKIYDNYSLTNHTGTINVSSSAVFNAPLRMRVISDYNVLTGACANVQYGQAEDYTVVILPNTIPPVVSFNANTTITCNGIIAFNNTTTNGTSFLWNFGDGTTSTAQNPTHTYTAAGTYTVFLKSCNSFGCDSLTQTNYITVSAGGPVTASCTPQTINYCCGMGIYNVTFNSINKTSADGSDGYKDYSCSSQTNITAGQNYTLSVTTGVQYSEYVKVFIDYNNDGTFNNSTEKVYVNAGLTNHSATITISSTAILNVPLRMRVMSDYDSIANGCADLMYGQAEDYSVTILPNSNPPVAGFTIVNTSCGGTISLVNTTSNATSLVWNFGDGTTSTVQNPAHTYTAAGIYYISLTACNQYGCDSITNPVIINTGGPVAAACSPSTTSYCCGLGIYNVHFAGINNTTNDGIDGYTDYSCSMQTGLLVGQSYALNVITNNQYDEYVNVWIDYNNDGNFNAAELIFNNNSLQYHNGNITIPGSAVLNTPLRMRVSSDYNVLSNNSCTNQQYGQTEDYQVTIVSSTSPPVAGFTFNLQPCDSTVYFSNASTSNATSWAWSFGDGGTSTLQNPVHTYSLPGSYAVQLTASNSFGSNTYITVVTNNSVIAGFNIPDTVFVLANNTFQNTSAGGLTYLWDFGDGDLSTNINPVHSFADQANYTVTLTATNGSGCSDTYTFVVASVFDPNSIQKIDPEFNFEVWPNPSSGLINISLLEFENKDVIIAVFNSVGQEISRETLRKTGNIKKTIDLSDKANGLYMVKVSNGSREFSKKILINK